MKINKYYNRFSNKSKLLYFIIGLFVFVTIGWTLGTTRFVMVFLSNHQVSKEYIDKVNEIYIDDKTDIYLCVKGNTHKMTDVEFWIVIPSNDFIPDFSMEKSNSDIMYNENNFGISTISQDKIFILDCETHPVRGLIQFDVLYKSFSGQSHDETQNLVDEDIENTTENKIVLMKYEQSKSTIASKIIYTWFSAQSEKYTMWFWTENIGDPELINPMWNILYIPAIIIDILLWPIWLLIFISFLGKRPI